MATANRKYVNRNVGQEVYVIGHSEGFVKVGRSKDPADRCRDIGRNCPACELTLVETFEIGGGFNPALVENHVHDRLSEHEVQSEWFGIPPESAIEMVADAVGEYEAGNEPEPELPPEEGVDLPDNHFVRVFRILEEGGEIATGELGLAASLGGTRRSEVLTALHEAGVVDNRIDRDGGPGRPPTLWRVSDSFEETVEEAVGAGLVPSREAAVREKMEGVVREYAP